MFKLNIQQKIAIDQTSGPLLVIAGAGTGKTGVVTQKIVSLIEKGLAKPEEILALTFTEKTAEEMTNRVEQMLESDYTDLEISTFHSFCQKILEYYGLDIGLPNHFNILTQTDAWLLVRKNLTKFNFDYYAPLGNPTKHIHELVKHFSKCKDELITPKEYLDFAQSKKINKDNADYVEEDKRLQEVANAYHVYNQLLLDNSSLDFGDLIFYVVKLLQTRPNILKKLQNRFKYILVDEFQDVNWAQYFLVKLLGGHNPNLTVVGDDDQSIYAFRGASVSNIMRFKDDFPEAKQVVLTENYRSNQEILDFSYKLIQGNNPDRLESRLNIDKHLKSSLIEPEKSVIHIHSKTLEEETAVVVNEIERLKNNDPESTWDDFAILVRANNQAEPFLAYLENKGIPYEFLASAGLYRQPIVLDCLSFFRSIIDYHESASVYRLLKMAPLNLADEDLVKITHLAKQKSVSLYKILKESAVIDITEEGKAKITKLLGLLSQGFSAGREEKPTTALYHFLEESGYLSFLTKGENEGNAQIIHQIYHLKQFFEYISRYEFSNPQAGVIDFLEHYEYVLESGDAGALYQMENTPDSVNISTIHSAKGLEYKYVFVVNMVEDRFPSRSRGLGIEIPIELIKEQLPEGDEHLQEERRLFYVAMTRAKKKLYLTSADNYGGVRTKKISRFLAELDLDTIKKEKNNIIVQTKKMKAKEEKGEFVFSLPKMFSYSQIKSYLTCPYQYKLSHILHLPVKGSASFSFGQSMHGTMQDFYTKMQELNLVKQASLFAVNESMKQTNHSDVKVPTLEELLMMYDKNWLDDWYKNSQQRQDYYDQGKDILRTFYKSEEGNWRVPVALESWFKIKIGDYGLHGRIDRIDQLADGTLEIIDYKTGKSKEKVTGEDKDQLLIYQIAVNRLDQYKYLGIPAKLTYFYLNDNVRVSFLGKDKEIEKLEQKLVETMELINKKDFTATPGKYTCDFCDFKDICDYRE